jgi:hypothetical protein
VTAKSPRRKVNVPPPDMVPKRTRKRKFMGHVVGQAFQLGTLQWLAGYPFDDNPCRGVHTRHAWWLGWKQASHEFTRDGNCFPVRPWKDKK